MQDAIEQGARECLRQAAEQLNHVQLATKRIAVHVLCAGCN